MKRKFAGPGFQLINIFINGFSLMGLEVSCKRLLIPYIGSDLNSWTILLVLSLAACSAGYFCGSLLNSKRSQVILLITPVWIILTPFLVKLFIPYLVGAFSSINALRFVSCVLFVAPLLFLVCAVYPELANNLQSSQNPSAKAVKPTVSLASAFSSMGGGIGALTVTFLFFETFEWNIKLIFVFMGFIYFLISILNTKKIKTILLFAPLLFVASNLVLNIEKDENVIYEKNTGLQKIYIVDQPFWFDPKETMRLLYLSDYRIIQSGVLKSKPGMPTFDSLLSAPFLAWGLNGDIKNILIIGLGGGVGTRDLLRKFDLKGHPKMKIDVVDVDRHLLEVSQKFFEFPANDPRFHFYVQDGRTFINKTQEKYDLIYMDMETGLSKSNHLLTVESFSKAKNLLTSNGVLFLNTLNIVKRNGFTDSFSSLYKTLKASFRDSPIFVFETQKGLFGNVLMLVCNNPQARFNQEVVNMLDTTPNKSHVDKIKTLLTEAELNGIEQTDSKIYTDDLNLASKYFRNIENRLLTRKH